MHELVNADELNKTKWNAEMFFIHCQSPHCQSPEGPGAPSGGTVCLWSNSTSGVFAKNGNHGTTVLGPVLRHLLEDVVSSSSVHVESKVAV